jgi:trans-2,3-dihydro-3-hydroxyanthranilate isomerase
VDREKSTAHVRVFCPQVGVAEDPATGSAAVALGVFLGGRGVLAEGRSGLTIAQGAEMGRPSALEVQVRIAGGVAAEVAVQGGVRMVAKGELLALPDA